MLLRTHVSHFIVQLLECMEMRTKVSQLDPPHVALACLWKKAKTAAATAQAPWPWKRRSLSKMMFRKISVVSSNLFPTFHFFRCLLLLVLSVHAHRSCLRAESLPPQQTTLEPRLAPFLPCQPLSANTPSETAAAASSRVPCAAAAASPSSHDARHFKSFAFSSRLIADSTAIRVHGCQHSCSSGEILFSGITAAGVRKTAAGASKTAAGARKAAAGARKTGAGVRTTAAAATTVALPLRAPAAIRLVADRAAAACGRLALWGEAPADETAAGKLGSRRRPLQQRRQRERPRRSRKISFCLNRLMRCYAAVSAADVLNSSSSFPSSAERQAYRVTVWRTPVESAAPETCASRHLRVPSSSSAPLQYILSPQKSAVCLSTAVSTGGTTRTAAGGAATGMAAAPSRLGAAGAAAANPFSSPYSTRAAVFRSARTRCWAGCCGRGAASRDTEASGGAAVGGLPGNCTSNSCESEQQKPALAAGALIPRVGTSLAGPRPNWFHVPAPQTTARGGEKTRFELLQQQIRGLKLHTVCEEAKCPNIGECWNGGTATLMLLGDTCTRGCRFCAIKTSGKPPPPDPEEPEKVAAAVAKWDVDYLVLTSVDRDDMPDGGAEHFARTVRLLKQVKPEMLVECLVSDFQGEAEAVRTVASSGLDVYAHNVETVRRLTPYVRDKRADYYQSLRVLQLAKQLNPAVFTKSSIMVGLGEIQNEVIQTLSDLRAHDVDAVTFGQYLRPTKHQLGVVEYVTPQTFAVYQKAAEDMGFKYVASGPLVRSSYKAGEYFMRHLLMDERRKRAENQAIKRVKLKADIGHLKGESEQIISQ